MNKMNFTRLFFLLVVGLGGFFGPRVFSQDMTPWKSDVYGNSWIQDFSKKYVRLTVNKDGMYKITAAQLQMQFPGVPLSNFQLWNRGKEVAIGVLGSDIIFYGKKNDGASDGLMFRPETDRLNPYKSFFSEKGYYFLTTLPDAGVAMRFPAAGSLSPISGTAEQYHIQKFIKTYSNKFAHTSFGVETSRNPSYYSIANSWNSTEVAGPVGRVSTNSGVFRVPINDATDFNMSNFVNTPDVSPNLEIMVAGMNEGSHVPKVSVGKDASSLTVLTGLLPSFSGYFGKKASVDLASTSFNLTNAVSQPGYLRVEELGGEVKSWLGLSFYKLTYPQSTTMSPGGTQINSAVFNFKKGANTSARITILNAPSGSLIYDISDPYSPKPILGVQSGATLDVMVNFTASVEFNLLVVNPLETGILSIPNTDITTVNFKPVYASNNGVESIPATIDPSKYDYLIITHNINKTNSIDEYPEFLASAINYGKYRAKPEGGSYNTLVINIRDLYDQFNFGEPSPIAIKRFTNYMLQGQPARAKHNIFLIGHGISYPAGVRTEMPGEIPTFGDPGSDVLLVAGLAGSDIDVQSIPIGRINAFTHTDIDNYLAKVKDYETYSGDQDLSWRKNIVNLTGAESDYEKTTFNSYFKYVTDNSIPAASVPLLKAKTTDASTYVSGFPTVPSDVLGWINGGVGLISYFGHGSISKLFLNLDNASGAQYTSNKKYCLFYVNGCEAGDVFNDRTQQYFGSDWVLTPNKGAIATVSTSYRAYFPDATQFHMYPFYEKLFSFQEGGTIGRILKQVSEEMVVNGSGRTSAPVTSSTREHINQLILLGDPAVVLLTTTSPLPVGLLDFKATLLTQNQVKLSWKTTWESNNDHFVIERSHNAKDFVAIGSVEGKGSTDTESSYSFVDSNPLPSINYYRLSQVDFTADALIKPKKSLSKIVKVEIPDTEVIDVFPNPAKDKLEIKINIPVDLSSWRLINSGGSKVKTGSSSKLDVTGLPTGMYILEVKSSAGDVYRKKIVKE